jgi:agmatine/peptidylarginine deiminase
MRMPDESEPHKCTWMAFGAKEDVRGKRLLEFARQNLATSAQAIARFEPVVLCVRHGEQELARPGVVVAHLDGDSESPEYELTRRHHQIMENATDAGGRKLEVVAMALQRGEVAFTALPSRNPPLARTSGEFPSARLA